MNTTQKSELIDEMIDELDRVRITKQKQIGYISDICEKSNHILLQIEASQKAKTSPRNTAAARFKYRKETLHALAKTIETFDRVLTTNAQTPNHSSGIDFETYITTTRAKIDFLASGLRKLLALNDTVNQIGSELRHDSDFELDSTDPDEFNSSE
ncbi:uncharacterized protein LOC129917702 [Episyrphus balteatus]|uniref:uncharacterized protein LOC129917702 n=1 Tax=Episyrphus balteatus TaxID=286459 RepID=UPI0024867555|nr:uncharacterized protein LOC129917702 [Episyrphus balteatus]